jgi:hypothetical protein
MRHITRGTTCLIAINIHENGKIIKRFELNPSSTTTTELRRQFQWAADNRDVIKRLGHGKENPPIEPVFPEPEDHQMLIDLCEPEDAHFPGDPWEPNSFKGFCLLERYSLSDFPVDADCNFATDWV